MGRGAPPTDVSAHMRTLDSTLSTASEGYASIAPCQRSMHTVSAPRNQKPSARGNLNILNHLVNTLSTASVAHETHIGIDMFCAWPSAQAVVADSAHNAASEATNSLKCSLVHDTLPHTRVAFDGCPQQQYTSARPKATKAATQRMWRLVTSESMSNAATTTRASLKTSLVQDEPWLPDDDERSPAPEDVSELEAETSHVQRQPGPPRALGPASSSVMRENSTSNLMQEALETLNELSKAVMPPSESESPAEDPCHTNEAYMPSPASTPSPSPPPTVH